MSEPIEYLAAPERTATDGFVIRSYMPGDGPLLQDAVVTSYDHLIPWMSWPKRDLSLTESEHQCRRTRGRYLLAEDFTVAVISLDGSKLLCGSGFHLRDGGLKTRSAEIGMFVRASEAGKGLGTAILVEMLRWGFDAWPWRRLVWRCDATNIASRRCAEKAGMNYEGTLRQHQLSPAQPVRDTVVYAALRDEWSST